MLRSFLFVALTGIFSLTQSVAFAESSNEKPYCESNAILCAAPLVGVVGSFIILPGIFASIEGASTLITCGSTAMQLNPIQTQDFVDYANFDKAQASEAFHLTCSQNKNNDSVFVPYMAGEKIQQKMLYSRFSTKEKCMQMKNDLEQYPLKINLLISEESVESLSTQESIYEAAFNEQRTVCNRTTLAVAEAKIKSLILSGKIEARNFFPLFFRNNLSTDPNAYIPAGSELLNPISIDQFNALEKAQRASEAAYAEAYPEAMARAKALRKK